MSARQFLFNLIFRADAAQAKSEAAQVEQAVNAVGQATDSTARSINAETEAARKNSAAKSDQVQKTRELAKAEREAAEAARKTGQSGVAGSAPSGSTPAPVPQPAPAPALTPAEIQALQARYVPLTAAKQALDAELAQIAKGQAGGALNDNEASEAQARVRASYDKTVESIRRVDGAMMGNRRVMRLQAHEARNLSLQFSDTFQSLALGMSPLQVMLQQGPQVVDIFGGIGNTLRYMRSALSGMRVLMAGTAAAVVGGAVAWEQYLRSMKAVEAAANGPGGRRIGVTPEMLELAARQGADEADISVKSARGLTAQLAGSGQIGADSIRQLVAMSKDFAATIGVETDDVGAKMVEMFADPAKAAEELYRTRNLLKAADVEQIQRLDAQNQRWAAQAALIEAIAPHLADASAGQTGFQRARSAVGRNVSNAMNFVGGALGGARPDEDLLAIPDQIKLVDDKIAAARQSLEGPGNDYDRAITRAQIIESEKRLAALQGQLSEVEARSKAAEDRANAMRGIQALAVAGQSPANSTVRQERAMRDQLAAMQAGLAAGDLSIEQRQDMERAIEGVSAALDALTDRQQFALDLEQAEYRLATARNPLERAEAAAIMARMQAQQRALGVTEQQNEADKARRQVLGEVLAASATQAVDMADEAQARQVLLQLQASGLVSSAEAEEWLNRELTLRPLIAAATEAEGEEKTRLEQVIANLRSGYAALTKARIDDAVEAKKRASADAIADLQLEADLIGRSTAERIRAQAQAAAEREIRDLNLDPASDQAGGLRADAMAEAEARIRRDQRQGSFDLDLQRRMDALDMANRLAQTPVERAAIAYEQEYARAVAEGVEPTEAAERATQARARALGELQAGLVELMRSQDQELDRLRLEARLAGQSDVARSRALAVYEAELEIRKLGLAAGSEEARQLRERALLIADQRRETEKLTDAWGDVREAAESAIEDPIRGLLDGDIEGALENVAKNIASTLAELSIINPMKNAALGTDYATMQDLGGLKGIWATLFGEAGGSAEALATDAARSVSAMQVNAASVTIGGPGAMSLLAGSNAGAANANFAPGLAGGLSGSSDIQSQVWQFFAGKGLQPHQIAGIMGNIQGESGFNPLAVGDFGQAFGLFQWNDRKDKLFDHIGGKQNLGDVQKQLEFAWHELMTSESGALQRLLASKDVGGATDAWMRGFERPSNEAMIDSWGTRLGAAEQALTQFSTTAQTTTTDLGTLGSGMGVFGQALQGFAQGGAQGGLNGLLGGIGQIVASAIGIPGFATGGDFAGGLRIVGENGPELEATGPSRIFNAAQTREILTSRAPAMVANTPAPPVVQIQPVLVNNTGRPVEVETEQTTDARGQQQTKYVISAAVAQGINARGGPAARTLRSMGAVQPPRRRQ